MEFLVRFSQYHETFRVPELEALAIVENVSFTIASYDPEIPFCIIRISSASDEETLASAARLIRRAILTQSIYELWATGTDLDTLHASHKSRSSHLWHQYGADSWKFEIDSFQGTRKNDERREIINTFRYMPLTGPIKMKDPQQVYTILEEWPMNPNPNAKPSDTDEEASPKEKRKPKKYYFGRYLGKGARDLITRFDLKKRPYISTTSMDSELALVTANLALASPGKIFYDPFVGTGSFPLACSAFGAISWGSDIDGRTVRGSGNDARAESKRGLIKGEKTLRGNFKFYGIKDRLGDVFTSDLTNTPLRRVEFGKAASGGGRGRLFDGIVCDPPYGVREGLRVLGHRDPEGSPWVIKAGESKYKDPTYVPPKKPYSFLAMLDDILHFSSETLLDNGRLSFWMPTTNEDSTTSSTEIEIPTHPCLEMVVCCVQPFRKWSRRLLTYRKLPDEDVRVEDLEAWQTERMRRRQLGAMGSGGGGTADELNSFRKAYFEGFQKVSLEQDGPPPTAVVEGEEK